MSQHNTSPGAVAMWVVVWSRRPGRLGASSADVLPVLAQHVGHAGLAAQVNAFVGQHRHDACRWH